MPALVRIAAFSASLIATIGSAAGQDRPADTHAGFALMPAPVPTNLPAAPRRAGPFRYPALAPLGQIGEPALPALPISLQRRTLRFGGVPMALLMQAPSDGFSGRPFDTRPRSRVTRLRIEERIAIDERIDAVLGWRGMKLTNRNGNVAVGGGSDRLSAHDWFLPRGALTYRPSAALTLSISYRQTMRAFEGAGTIGAMGMSRPDFDALRDTLRPETARQTRMNAMWRRGEMRASLDAYRGQLADAVGFRDYMPVNLGSASISGMTVTVGRRLTPRLDWSVSYGTATGRAADGGRLREQEATITGRWNAGPWQASIGASRASGAMLAGSGLASQAAAMRVEAAVGYTAPGIGGRPLDLSLRLADPSLLASARLLDDNGAVRAADRARALMLQATTRW